MYQFIFLLTKFMVYFYCHLDEPTACDSFFSSLLLLVFIQDLCILFPPIFCLVNYINNYIVVNISKFIPTNGLKFYGEAKPPLAPLTSRPCQVYYRRILFITDDFNSLLNIFILRTPII